MLNSIERDINSKERSKCGRGSNFQSTLQTSFCFCTDANDLVTCSIKITGNLLLFLIETQRKLFFEFIFCSSVCK